MRLNLQSDYALGLLMQLDTNEDLPVTVSELARYCGTLQIHIAKGAYTLSRKGVIEPIGPRTGNMRLVRWERSTRMGAHVRDMESDLALVGRFPGDAGSCHRTRACWLKGILGDALLAFTFVLDRYPIVGLTKRNVALTQPLSMDTSQ